MIIRYEKPIEITETIAIAETKSIRIFRFRLKRKNTIAKIIRVGKPFGLNVTSTDPGNKRSQKRFVDSKLLLKCDMKNADTSIKPAVNGMSCQRVIPIADTTGVATSTNELIAATFFVESEYAKHVTLYVKASPLIRVNKGIASPRNEK